MVNPFAPFLLISALSFSILKAFSSVVSFTSSSPRFDRLSTERAPPFSLDFALELADLSEDFLPRSAEELFLSKVRI